MIKQRYFCDICGKETEMSKMASCDILGTTGIEINSDYGNHGVRSLIKHKDICIDCTNKLAEFIETLCEKH